MIRIALLVAYVVFGIAWLISFPLYFFSVCSEHLFMLISIGFIATFGPAMFICLSLVKEG